MSTLPCGADSRAAQSAVASGACERAETYLTNEVFLYRLVGITAGDAGELVEVEDCYFLDVVRVPIENFHARRLRVVTPAAGDN